MKKLLIISALTLVTATVGYSQGQIQFANTSASFNNGAGPARLVTTVGVVGFADGSGLTGTNYVAQLYLASDFSQVTVEGPSIFRIPTTTQPGTWAGGTRNFITSGSTFAAGSTVNLVVRVWDAGAGQLTTYANSSVTGQSAVFSYTIPAVGTPPAGLSMVNFQPFTVSPVPEPSTIALGVLGAGSLLFLRRKK